MGDITQDDRIVMYGAPWCPDCRRAKQFFAEHFITYQWIDIDDNPEAIVRVEAINNGLRIIPTIIFPDGGVLTEPSNAQLAEKLGLQTKAARKYYDVVIIGAGPTGLSTAIYTGREGLSTLIIEKAAPGGQARVTQILENFPGFDQGVTGEEFGRRMSNHARRFGAEILESTQVTGIERKGQYLCVTTSSGDEYGAGAALIATGSRYRRLGVPGERDLIGTNIHFCATCDGAFYKDKEVLVIGGGNSGFEEGLFLTRFARQVTIVEFEPKARASAILQEKVARRQDMAVITNHAVKEFVVSSDGKLVRVIAENRGTGEDVEWRPDGVFVYIGLTPNADFAPESINRDRWGFIVTDKTLMTSLEGVFAAGDVRAGSTKQAVAAAGEGATAALMIRQYLQEQGEAHQADVGAV
jgi:thioredoxin reductase (NADPH)